MGSRLAIFLEGLCALWLAVFLFIYVFVPLIGFLKFIMP